MEDIVSSFTRKFFVQILLQIVKNNLIAHWRSTNISCCIVFCLSAPFSLFFLLDDCPMITQYFFYCDVNSSGKNFEKPKLMTPTGFLCSHTYSYLWIYFIHLSPKTVFLALYIFIWNCAYCVSSAVSRNTLRHSKMYGLGELQLDWDMNQMFAIQTYGHFCSALKNFSKQFQCWSHVISPVQPIFPIYLNNLKETKKTKNYPRQEKQNWKKNWLIAERNQNLKK